MNATSGSPKSKIPGRRFGKDLSEFKRYRVYAWLSKRCPNPQRDHPGRLEAIFDSIEEAVENWWRGMEENDVVLFTQVVTGFRITDGHDGRSWLHQMSVVNGRHHPPPEKWVRVHHAKWKKAALASYVERKLA